MSRTDTMGVMKNASPPPSPTAPMPPDELAGSLRTEISRLAYHLRSPATLSGITPTRLVALSALAKAPDGRRPGDLAGQLGMSAASMTRLVEILVAAGWVAREPDPRDARATLVRLTPAGRGTLDDLRLESESRLAADIGALSSPDRDALARAVPVLRAIADSRLAGGS
ncbi:MAG: MarR family transcriptional regulator [Humibacillus sp.]|nr:MarR family transcriptional regulator [Humibacillus sp.]MDN5778247.1 MarR family transcriptional regulator [Humibacillus sp.]